MAWHIGSTPTGMDPKVLIFSVSAKTPTDTIPLTVDFSTPLSIVSGDIITTSNPVTIKNIRNDGQPTDLVLIPPYTVDASGTLVTFWVSGGSADFEYLITVTVYTLHSQAISRSFVLPVFVR